MEFSQHDKSLYERVGGEKALERLLDRFYHRVTHDPEIGHYFTHVPIEKLKGMQHEFFSMATGGPVTYSGRPLSQVHRHLAISRREFQRFTEHLITTLKEEDIDDQDVYEIIAKINLYADEITNEASYGDD
jgi:hemoglobin